MAFTSCELFCGIKTYNPREGLSVCHLAATGPHGKRKTATTAPSAPSAAKAFAPESLRVLLFEDSAMDAVLIKKFLQTAGVRLTYIFHTDTIPSALQVLTRENVDLCLTDYYLRPHTGFELMDEARRFDVDIPFIVLTGMDDRSIDHGALARDDVVTIWR